MIDLDSLLKLLEKLKQSKMTWTDSALTVINNFMSTKELYEDCIQANKTISELLQKHKKLSHRFTRDELYKWFTDEKNMVSEKISYLKAKIEADEKLYKQQRGKVPDAQQTKFSTMIHEEKIQLQNTREYYDNKFASFDLELLRKAYHYASAEGGHTIEGKQAVAAISEFCDSDLVVGKDIDITKKLINIYQVINHTAACREKLLSYWENIITKDDYLNYKKQRLDVSHLNSLSYFAFPQEILDKHKTADMERKQIQLQLYLDQYLPLGLDQLNELQKLFVDFLNENKHSLIKSQKDHVKQLLDRLDDSITILQDEKEFLLKIDVKPTSRLAV